eukprot:CAMPEP_0119363338 /NCGR_PEP_ID=MMETSP1334-20130426/10250_1 /TAXON_ID=127549 /ORGANISM="Calcidiscus leptoporus, Strain RCC1130" /LENGTH=54 /DNA_ID=CAMNT_0007378763 /DNA_START=33 /DNA_END=197 /DNA_ORIENTATION=-
MRMKAIVEPARLSAEARHLIKALTEPAAEERLTVKAAQSHPWTLAGTLDEHSMA